jgi:hypothetical protein
MKMSVVAALLMLVSLSSAVAAPEWMTITKSNGASARVMVFGIDNNGVLYSNGTSTLRLLPSELSTGDRIRFGFATQAETKAYYEHLKAMAAVEQARAAREKEEREARQAAYDQYLREREVAAQERTADEVRQLREEYERRRILRR